MKKLFLILVILILAVGAFLIYRKQHATIHISTLISPTPNQLLTAVPSGTMLPTTFTQTSWKIFSSNVAGVTFAYPPEFKLPSEETPHQSPYYDQPTVLEDSQRNLVEIDYAYSYMFRITKVITNQSLKEWVAKNDDNFIYHYANEYSTTLNGYSAILSLETPEGIKNMQVPETTYYVKPTANTIYQIEYAIPIAIPSDSPDKGVAESKSNDMLNNYIPQILGSVKFL